ncbi:hypothetical protein FHE66_07180 [Georgenia sp. 311]|nr:hypothetical protein FHE66_07180 [Georgenia sp. 311]
MTMRSTTTVLAAAVVLSAVACSADAGGSDAGGMSGGDAGCAPPVLSVEPVTAAAGDSVTVTGEGLFDGCADVSGVGPDGTVVAVETQEPHEGVAIVFSLPGREPVTLATVDASESGSFTVEVTVPDVDGGGTGLVEATGTFAEAELTVTP